MNVSITGETASFSLNKPDRIVVRWSRQLHEACLLRAYDQMGEKIGQAGFAVSGPDDKLVYSQSFQKQISYIRVLQGQDYFEKNINFNAKYREE